MENEKEEIIPIINNISKSINNSELIKIQKKRENNRSNIKQNTNTRNDLVTQSQITIGITTK